MKHKIKYSKTDFMSLVSKLNALSPLHTLERGYAIVSKNDKNIDPMTLETYHYYTGGSHE